MYNKQGSKGRIYIFTASRLSQVACALTLAFSFRGGGSRRGPKISFFSQIEPVFLYGMSHVYWPYKVPCKISDLWPQYPQVAAPFCK